MPIGIKSKPPASDSPFEDRLLYPAYALHHCHLDFFKENENMKVSSSDNTKYGADDYSFKTLRLTVPWVEIFHSRFLKQIGNIQLKKSPSLTRRYTR